MVKAFYFQNLLRVCIGSNPIHAVRVAVVGVWLVCLKAAIQEEEQAQTIYFDSRTARTGALDAAVYFFRSNPLAFCKNTNVNLFFSLKSAARSRWRHFWVGQFQRKSKSRS